MNRTLLGLVMLAFTWRAAAAQPAAQPANQPASARPEMERTSERSEGGPSTADQAQAVLTEMLPTIGKNMLGRLRRATALGLFAGAGGGIRFTDDVGNSGEWRVSGGLAFHRFDVPLLPNINDIRDLAVSQIVEKLRNYQPNASGQYDRELVQRIARGVLDLLLAKYQPKHFETPSLCARVELARLLKSEAWEAGFLVGVGVGPVTFGGGPMFVYGDRAALYGAFEIGKPVLLSKGLRAPVLDIFLRANLAATTRDQNPDQLLLGARIGFDAI